ncbi:MAG: hypothetical protein ACFFCS_06460 [Candidatus Hodarchaeota archaeon]
MILEEIFKEIIAELDSIDSTRERVMVLSRDGVRACSEAIKKLHRKEAGVSGLLEKARENLKSITSIANENPKFQRSGHLITLFQEYVEALALHWIITGEEFQAPSTIEPPVPVIPYLTGLCDVIGELRRACLDCVRTEKFDEAMKYFDFMEQLHDIINSLDYPNAVIPNIRHKSDVNRKLINATRSDLTMAIHIDKLNKNLGNVSKD